MNFIYYKMCVMEQSIIDHINNSSLKNRQKKYLKYIYKMACYKNTNINKLDIMVLDAQCDNEDVGYYELDKLVHDACNNKSWFKPYDDEYESYHGSYNSIAALIKVFKFLSSNKIKDSIFISNVFYLYLHYK